MEPTLHPHHPFRYVVILGFLAMVFLSTERAGQSEMVRIAAEQTALHNESRAPAVQPEEIVLEETAPAVLLEGEGVAEVSLQPSGHLPIPAELKGIYLTAFSAGSSRGISRALELVEAAGINAVVIDIKDASGKLSYQPLDPILLESGVGTNRIKDLPSTIETLHNRGVYVIGRLSVFQDPFFAKRNPTEAFLDTRTGSLWRDYKGLEWLRPNSPVVWDYTIAIARDARAQGFDEINLDYVRFPSDGELSFLDRSSFSASRADTIADFFAYLGPVLRADGLVLSADLFGLTMSASDDLGIGQKLELIAPHVDFICPMVYPSHFASGAYGIADPAAHPYEIIRHSLSRGAAKLEAAGIPKEKLRPWLQDFNLGAIYTAEMVRSQILASEELGLSSWMLWDPRNIYTKEALLLPEERARYTTEI